MKVNDVTKWTVINHQASSLFNIADGVFENTKLGNNTWLSLMGGSRLQENCNKEGYNINIPGHGSSYLKARIGIIANNQNDCETCNSCIGFGTSIDGCHGEIKTTRGNIAICGRLDDKNTSAFGHIFVQ